MGKNSRSRIMLNRKRFNARGSKIIKYTTIASFIVILLFLLTFTITNNLNVDKTTIVSDNNDVNIYDLEDNNIISSEVITEEKEEMINNNEPVISENISLTILGEIMMGGQVTTNTSYLYNTSFKKIFSLTRDSDFTYANLSTNITNLTEINNPKSKYIVTKEIKSAIISLGIDAVNLASDHMIDFPKDIFNNTVSILKENNTYISGLNDSILYLEKNNKKIAIIAANNVFIGTKNNYTDYGINVYNKEKMQNDISIAKQNADIVIVDIHWGREYIYGVTEEMKQIAYSAIDSGADLIMGSHAMGIYPIITYKNIPIIYSTGYIMTDSYSNIDKQSFIFNIDINSENKITSLEMVPIYIKDKKEVIPYYEYDIEFATLFTEQLNNWNIQNGLNSQIVNNKIQIVF